MIRKILCAVLSVLMLCTCTVSCGKKSNYAEHVTYAMDTYVTFRLPNDADLDLDALYEECETELARLESLMSAHDEDSRLCDFNGGGEDILRSEDELYSVIAAACDIALATDGAYRPTIGALSLLWNVTGGGPVPSADDIKKALENIGTDGISLTESAVHKENADCLIDLGGIAKGYAAQCLTEYLSASGVPYGLVSMGGNIGVFGEKPDGKLFRVGICNPLDTSGVACYLEIESGFVSVSGSYERFFEQDGVIYHHILDPQTGYPSDSELLSVAVWSKDGAAADALSTALFVMGEEKTRELYDSGKLDFEAVLVSSDGELILTDGIAEERFECAADGFTVRRMH